MLSSIILRCPGCSARIKVPVQLLGQQRHCPGCNILFVLHPQAPADLGPLFVEEVPQHIAEWHRPMYSASS